MTLQLKNDREIKESMRESKDALDENTRVLDDLLVCLYGVGGVSKERIDKLRSRAKEDGKSNPRGL